MVKRTTVQRHQHCRKVMHAKYVANCSVSNINWLCTVECTTEGSHLFVKSVDRLLCQQLNCRLMESRTTIMAIACSHATYAIMFLLTSPVWNVIWKGIQLISLSGNVLLKSTDLECAKSLLIILHRCSVCLKTFARKEHLDNHFRSHSGESPFRCQVRFKFDEICQYNPWF